jgi:murein DD-endopeptidase MepM/ murein hydrolase activator NlpD
MRFREFKLTEAAKDPDVVQAQTLLKDLGYNIGPTGIDGIYGPATKAAAEKFKNDLNKSVTALSPSLGPNANPKVMGIVRKPKGSNSPNTPNTIPSGKTDVPAGLPVKAKVSSPFGYRSSVGKGHNHNGTDFAVPVGTPVVAPADGVIVSAGNNGGGEGIFVILNAGNAVHKFFHLSKILVSPGQRVKRGETVGLSGNTGYSTGPHLHWEKHIAGRPVDPMANIG